MAADDALEVKPLDVYFVETHRGLRGHDGPRGPHCARKVHPLVKSFCMLHFRLVEHFEVPLQEKVVVLRTLGHGLCI